MWKYHTESWAISDRDDFYWETLEASGRVGVDSRAMG